MRFLIIHFLVQMSFLMTVLGHFSQCNFTIFRRWPVVTEIFSQHHHHKKASYGTMDSRTRRRRRTGNCETLYVLPNRNNGDKQVFQQVTMEIKIVSSKLENATSKRMPKV